MKKIIATLGVAGILAAVAGLLVVNTGLFNVAASWEDPALVSWVLSTASDSSIKRHAASIKAPATKGDKQIDEGFRSYREMCAICHTPPSADESPVTQGLNPKPPELSESADEFTSSELFWVIKNGIRMTGMPAWGPTHEDEEIWDIVAFLKTLPNMSKEDYEAMARRLEGGHSHSGDGHGADHHATESGTGDHHNASAGHLHGTE